MSKRTAAESIAWRTSVKPASHAAGTVTGAAVDTLGFDEAMMVLDCGVFTATGDVTAKVTECDTSGGTYTDVTGATTTNKVQAADELPYVGNLNLAKRKRYLKIVLTVADDAIIAGAGFALSAAKTRPVAQTNAVEFKV